MGSKPVSLELTVIIGGGTPDIQIHGMIQEFHPLIGHLRKHTGKLIVAVGEVCGGESQVSAVLGDGDAVLQNGLSLPVGQSDLISVILILQSNLVKAKIKALGDQLRGVFCMVVDLQEAAALSRNLNI